MKPQKIKLKICVSDFIELAILMNFPHDKLIKSVFANEKNAIEFLSKQLPQELVQAFKFRLLA